MRLSVILLAGLAALGPACTGDIADPLDTPPSGTEACDPSKPEPGPTYLRRLTNAEYRRTVALMFGEGFDALTDAFPPDSATKGYTNNAEGIAISPLHVERYESAARSIAADVAVSGRLEALAGCGPADTACLDGFIDGLGRRAFRRPLDEDERAAFRALAASTSGDPDPYTPFRLVVEGALQSPSFLFRVERGTTEEGGRIKLTGFEVAARLSFLLQGRAPDDALLDRAALGELDTADGVRGVALELLGTAETEAVVLGFANEWLQLGALGAQTRDPARFPLFGPELLESMALETESLARAALLGGGDARLLLTSRDAYLDASLAELYGVSAPAEPGPYTFGEGEHRAGLLTQASVLTVTAANESAAFIRRGKYVRDALLCESILRDPNAPPLDAAQGQSAEELFAAHLADPACSHCHEKLDPIGHGFARYDAIGAYHETDPSGAPIAETGDVTGVSVGAFTGPVDLGARLADLPEVHRCMVVQTFRYGFGRGEIPVDECTIDTLTDGFVDGGYSFEELILELTASDAFRYRSATDAEDF